jgi:hypothetical protein
MAGQPKLNLYKFVSVPSAGKKLQSGTSLVKAFNNIGATLNSSVIITKQLYEAVLKQTQDRIKQQQRDERRLGKSRDAASEAKQEGTGKKGAASAVKNFFSESTPNFFRGIANLATFFLRAFVIKNVLNWLADPSNREKIVKLVEGIGKILGFLWNWAKSGVFNTLDGLSKMFGNGNWIEKLVGFGQFIAGLATLFLGVRWLKNPLNLVKDFKFVLTTLWKGLTSAKARLIARAGLNVLRNPVVLGVAAVGATAYLANKVTGQQDAAKVQTENAARAQQGKSLPVPGVGGVGDVPASPMLEGAAEGGIKQQGSPMKPLSSLPSVMKGKGGPTSSPVAGKTASKATSAADMTNKVSKAMFLPFKVVGAGLLAAMAGSLSMMGPFGVMLLPMITSLMGPIAGYFGLPAALVKTIAAKGGKIFGGKGFGDNLASLFGKGKGSKGKGKATGQFKPSGDTTVLGLLSDILAALMFINGKGSSSSSTTPTPTPTPTPKPAAPKAGSTQIKNFKAGDSKVQALKGTTQDLENKGYTYVGGTNNQFFRDKQGRFYRAKQDGQTQGFFGMGRTDLFTLSAADQADADKYNELTAAKLKANTGSSTGTDKPNRSVGGWITGPMTGYPVSLDGGNSVSFIGHGKEWVGGFAKGGSTGNAFVIPYDTPATRKDPSLTSKRYSQAKRLGARLPDNDRITHKGSIVKNTAPGRADGGIVSAAKKAVSEGKRGPATPPCASWVRMVLGMAGHPAADKVTSKGDLDPQGTAYNGRDFAASFAGSDMGTVVKSQSSLEGGDIVLHKNTYGNYPAGAITHVSIASGDGQIYHQSTSGGAPKKGGIFNFAAGIRLGGSGSIGGDGEGGQDEEMSLEAALNMIRQGQSAVFDTYGMKAPVAPTTPTAATDNRDKAKRDAKDKARTDRAKLNPVPVVGKSAVSQASAPAAAIPPTAEVAKASDIFNYAPTLSLFQVNW